MSRRRHWVLCLAIGVLGCASAAQADDFYKGKTVTVLIGFTPGGGRRRTGPSTAGAATPGSRSRRLGTESRALISTDTLSEVVARAASGGGADFHFTLPLPAEGSTPP